MPLFSKPGKRDEEWGKAEWGLAEQGSNGQGKGGGIDQAAFKLGSNSCYLPFSVRFLEALLMYIHMLKKGFSNYLEKKGMAKNILTFVDAARMYLGAFLMEKLD